MAVERAEVAQHRRRPVGVPEHAVEEVRAREDQALGRERLRLVAEEGVGLVAEQFLSPCTELTVRRPAGRPAVASPTGPASLRRSGHRPGTGSSSSGASWPSGLSGVRPTEAPGPASGSSLRSRDATLRERPASVAAL